MSQEQSSQMADATGAAGPNDAVENEEPVRGGGELSDAASGDPGDAPSVGGAAGTERAEEAVAADLGSARDHLPAGDNAGADTSASQNVDVNAAKDPDDWVTGDQPMTGPQQSYLQTLAQEAGVDVPESLSKADASKMIDELQQRTGRGV